MPMRSHFRPLLLCILALAASVTASKHRAGGRAAAPTRFPVEQLSPGELPALWVFVRSECPPCHRHVAALLAALDALDTISRRRALARLHFVGDVPAATFVHRYPRHWLARLGIATTPLTWWVAADSSITRVWLGARDARSWTRALAFASGGAP